MTTPIQVTADGFVHVGRNEWVPLNQIQHAVHNVQHPHLIENREGQMTKSLHANCDQCPQQHTCNHQHTANYDPYEEALELPSTFRKVEQRDDRTPELQRLNFNREQHEEEHLPLPSTMRRK